MPHIADPFKIAETLGLISMKNLSQAKASDWYLICVNPMVFVTWGEGEIRVLFFQFVDWSMFNSLRLNDAYMRQ